MPVLLTLLRIKNLALVEDLEWEPGSGFTSITGETGAGKSIIIGALQLLLGERADKSLIRTGTDLCVVEAVFNGKDLARLNSQLNEAGIEPCDSELIIKRSISSGGTNRQFINGSPATLAVLKSVGDELVDLHGPHDHQSLLSTERQLALLDAFAHSEEKVREYEEHYQRLHRLQNEHAALTAAESVREHEVHLLRHQVSEIENARLSVSEEEEIGTRYKLAANSQRLVELTGTISRRLSEADDSILSQLAETQRLLRELEKIDPAQKDLAEAHASSVIELSEISRALSDYAQQVEVDSEQLNALEERISLLETLKRKYGRSIADVIAFGDEAAERLRKIEGRGDEIKTLEKQIDAASREVERTGQVLHKLRAQAAPELSESIRSNLRNLGFRQSEFEAQLSILAESRPTGMDAVEFLFSPNPGEPLKPLRTIASSGEISRLMLAIKSSLAEQDSIPLLIFDEIDANVGGEIANAVGARMQKLGDEHQVICITHLPQVAAAAASQFVVTKEVVGGRTHSRLSAVAGKARNEEIARMLGGKIESALKHAASLLRKP